MRLHRQILFYVALAVSPFVLPMDLPTALAAPTSTLRILTENWPPVSYEENGNAKGMAVELVQTIQHHLGDKDAKVGSARDKSQALTKAPPLGLTPPNKNSREKIQVIPSANIQVAAKTRIEKVAPQGRIEKVAPTGRIEVAPTGRIEVAPTGRIEVVPWARGYKLLQDAPNTLLFTVIRTPEREKLFTMLGPVARGNISIFSLVNPKKKFANAQEMKDQAIVAATRGTAFEATLKSMKYKNIFDVKDTETAVRLLIAGRVDLLCDDSLTIHDIIGRLKIDPKDIKTIAAVESYDLYLGFSPGTDPELVSDWKKTLETLKKNGQYAAIYRKWFHDLKPPSAVEIIGLAPIATLLPRSGSADN